MAGLVNPRVAWNSIRRARALLGAVLFGSLAIACSDAPVAAPKHFGPGHASLSITPTFASLPSGAPSIQLSRITAALIGPNGDSILVTSTFDGDSAILVFDLQITGSSENFTLHLTAFDHDGIVAYKSSQNVAIKPGDNPGVAAPVFVYAAPDAGIKALHVSPPSLSMNAGTTASLSVTGTGADGQPIPPLRIGWTARDPSVATVDDDGGVHAGAFQGSTWIVARTPNNVADSALVAVKAAVAQVSLSASSLQLIRGTGSSIVARLLDSGGHVIDDRVATWSSSDPSVATVSSSGAVQGIKIGSATLTATAEGKSATATVTVVSPIDHIELSPSSLTFASLGLTQNVVAKVVARAGASVDGLVPALSSSNPFIATVDGSGTVTSRSNGSATITATADGVSASTTVTVKQVAVSVTVSPASATATAVGDGTAFTATAFDATKNPMPSSTIAWSSSDASVASVNSDGLAVALKNGTTSITATVGALSGSGTLTVSQIAQKIALSADRTSFLVTQTATIGARVLDQNDNPIPAVKPQWSSSAPTIATVTQDGTVTGVSVGTARITATYDGVTANITVQVTAPPSLVLNATTAALRTGASTTFAVVSGGTGPFTWTVNDAVGGNATVGTVTTNGQYTAPAVAPSSPVSVCATQATPASKGCVLVTVTAPPTLDVSTLALFTSGSHQFTASGGTPPFTWSVNNVTGGSSTLGTVSTTGLYTAPTSIASSPTTVSVCVGQSTPLAQTCAQVTLTTATVTLTLNVTSIEKLPNGTQAFTVSGGTGPFSWRVNGVTNGNSTYGTISASGSSATYTAPAAVPTPAKFDICVSQDGPPAGSACASVTIDPVPSSGGEVVVFNDENMFDNTYGSPYTNNQLLYRNLVSFTASGARATQTGVMMHRGHFSGCGTTECSESSQSGFRSVLTNAGFTITDVDSPNATISSIPSSIKAIFLWMPTTSYSNAELNVLKQFASEGGRIIFVGERAGYYGTNGINTENAFFSSMGAQMTNQGGDVDCGHVDLPQSSLRTHQITQGLTGLAIACASAVTPGPNDYALFYDHTGTTVLAAVAKVDLTPLTIVTDRALRSERVVAPSSAPRTDSAGRVITGWSATPVSPPRP